MQDFPKMLYRDGDSLEWDGRRFDTLIVYDDVAETEALELGWREAKNAFKSTAEQLDHDGDGKAGGSVKGPASTAAKGARRKRGK